MSDTDARIFGASALVLRGTLGTKYIGRGAWTNDPTCTIWFHDC